MRYLIVGSSPTVTTSLSVLNRGDFDCVITSNAGIDLVEPDVYVCIDAVACAIHGQQARAAHANGARMVTLARDAMSLKSRDVEWFDEFVLVGKGEPTREAWGKFHFTGPFVLEYALRHGATSVTIIGCDGYRHGNAEDYYRDDGSKTICSKRAYTRTMEVIGPAWMKLASLFPEVEITQIGDPLYDITADNWEVFRCQTS